MPKQTDIPIVCYLAQDGKDSMFPADVRPRLRHVKQVMLFDLLNDPWETRNLAADPTCLRSLRSMKPCFRTWRQA